METLCPNHMRNSPRDISTGFRNNSTLTSIKFIVVFDFAIIDHYLLDIKFQIRGENCLGHS